MLTVNHDNASLESFHVRHLGYDIGNIAIANVGLAVFDRLEKFSPTPPDLLMVDEHQTAAQQSSFYDDRENLSRNETPPPPTTTTVTDSLDSVLEREIENGNGEESFFVCDLGIVVKQFNRWTTLLPRIKPFYAIKCNTDRAMLTTLINLGAGFDCASRAELGIMLDLGIDASRIIYANPCKPASHIRFAREKDIHTMTFDNLDELVKVKQEFPDANLVLRIVTDDSKSAHGFSLKFGAALSSVEPLLLAAKSMQMSVVGVSFHVGSGCLDASQYNGALKSARFVFDKARELGFDFYLLDIGGGFPGVEKAITLEQIADAINEAIDLYFPAWNFPNIRIISEPGRYFATAAYTLAVSITSRRIMLDDKDPDSKKYMYYLNDGIYGSFNCLFFDHAAIVQPEVFTQHGRLLSRQPTEPTEDVDAKQQLYNCMVWGPTCDSIDLIFQDIKLPEMDVGDWLVFRGMGAYTICAATTFNGFSHSKVIYINEEASRKQIERQKHCSSSGITDEIEMN